MTDAIPGKTCAILKCNTQFQEEMWSRSIHSLRAVSSIETLNAYISATDRDIGMNRKVTSMA